MHDRPTLRALVGATLLVALTGCPAPSPDPSIAPSGGASPAPAGSPAALGALKHPKVQAEGSIGKPGGTIRKATLGDPKTFNIALARETSSTEVLNMAFEGLAESHGLTGEMEPALAESWTTSKDGKTWTIKLREGLTWSDGKPLTADDVVFTYNDVVKNTAVSTDWRDGLLVEKQFPEVKKVDATTIAFTTVKPFAPFLRSVATLPILPKHALADTLVKDKSGDLVYNRTWGLDTDVKKIVTNGPFMFQEYAASQRIVLVKNPNYWRVDKNGTRLPYVDKLIITIVKDNDTLLLKFRGKESDLIENVYAKDYPLLKKEETAGNFKLHVGGPQFGSLFMMYNLKREKTPQGKYAVDPIKQKWFNNVKFRQATAHAIDKATIVKNLYRNLAEEQWSPEGKSSPFHLPDVSKYPYDLKKAEALLAEAGFKKKGAQLVDDAGNPVEFTLLTNANNLVRVETANTVKRDLERLGMKVNFRAIDFNTMVKKIDETYDWEAIMIGLTGGPDPHTGSNIWRSTGAMHMFRMKEPNSAEPWEKEIDKIFEEGMLTMDPAARKLVYAKYQKIAAENTPFIYTVNPRAIGASRNSLANARFSTLNNPSASLTWNIWELYLQ